MNYSNTFKRFVPFLLLPLAFIAFDYYSGRKINYVIYIAVFVSFALMALIMFLKSKGQKNILQNGIKGTAELIRIEDTGIQINFKPQLRLYLKVNIPGKALYELEHKEAMDSWNMTRLQPGTVFNIIADPNKTDNIIIDWSK